MRWDITPVIFVISVICPLIGGTPHTKMVSRLMLVFEGALFSSSTQSWASTRCSWVCNAIKMFIWLVYMSLVFFPHPILRFHLYLLISSTWIYILLEFYHYQLPINKHIYIIKYYQFPITWASVFIIHHQIPEEFDMDAQIWSQTLHQFALCLPVSQRLYIHQVSLISYTHNAVCIYIYVIMIYVCNY